jgi:hypothetical protein
VLNDTGRDSLIGRPGAGWCPAPSPPPRRGSGAVAASAVYLTPGVGRRAAKSAALPLCTTLASVSARDKVCVAAGNRLALTDAGRSSPAKTAALAISEGGDGSVAAGGTSTGTGRLGWCRMISRPVRSRTVTIRSASVRAARTGTTRTSEAPGANGPRDTPGGTTTTWAGCPAAVSGSSSPTSAEKGRPLPS